MRTALIGTGRRGHDWARALSDAGMLSALCMPGGDDITDAGVARHASAESTAAAPIDAAIISLHPRERHDAARTMMQAGRHVLADGPVASDPALFSDLLKLARRNGVTLAHISDIYDDGVSGIDGMAGSGPHGGVCAIHLSAPAIYGAEYAAYDLMPAIITADRIMGSSPQMASARVGGSLVAMLGYDGGRAATISLDAAARACEARVAFEQKIVSAILGPPDAGTGEAVSLLRSHAKRFAGIINGGTGGPAGISRAMRAAGAALLSGRQGVPIYLDIR